MAQTMTVKLTRFQNQPWGFRLHGGKDFSTPLQVQKVQPKSAADEAGLQPGDAILKVNEVNVEPLRHKEAQDVIVRAGNSFELTIQRGGITTWKPSVKPLDVLPRSAIGGGEPVQVTKTSLAANKQDFVPIGSAHNVKARPFGAIVNGSGNTVTALVHNPYNSPAGLYSMQNIADTLSQQAEVLATGVKGINFMKDDPPVNKESAVYRMVLEDQSDPRSFDQDSGHSTGGGGGFSPIAGLRHIEAPKAPPPAAPSADGAPKPGDNICSDCGRLIVGVFVRIKDKNLHADCFKCNTCGASLKNVGYYNINDKLYCDIHARQVARQNPPSENLTPITLGPGAPLPQGLPFIPNVPKPSQPSPKGPAYSPIPFHRPTEPSHVSPPKSPVPPTTQPTSTIFADTSALNQDPSAILAPLVSPSSALTQPCSLLSQQPDSVFAPAPLSTVIASAISEVAAAAEEISTVLEPLVSSSPTQGAIPAEAPAQVPENVQPVLITQDVLPTLVQDLPPLVTQDLPPMATQEPSLVQQTDMISVPIAPPPSVAEPVFIPPSIAEAPFAPEPASLLVSMEVAAAAEQISEVLDPLMITEPASILPQAPPPLPTTVFKAPAPVIPPLPTTVFKSPAPVIPPLPTTKMRVGPCPFPCSSAAPLPLQPLAPLVTSFQPQPTDLAPLSPGHPSWLPPRSATPDQQRPSSLVIGLSIQPLMTTQTLPPLLDLVDAAANIAATIKPLIPPEGAPKPSSNAPSIKPYGGSAGSKFTWPPPKLPETEEENVIETAPPPPAPTYRAPPTTQHTQYTPSVFKQGPTGPASPGGMVPLPKCASPTPFSSATTAPIFKPVAAPTTPATPAWSVPSLPTSFPSAPAPAPFTPPAAPAPAPFSAPAAPAAPRPSGGGGGGSSSAGNTGSMRAAPKRGRGVLKTSAGPGARIPICAACGSPIRGPFVTALGKTWCPEHFICVNASCRRGLQDVGFVEEQGQLYCEVCYENFLAPICSKCNSRIKGDCLNAIGKQWHPDCFLCAYCHTPFGNTHFFLEDGLPYCEKDWNELFTTKCVACGFPIEAGDRWVEALNSNYHSQCFKCSICNKNLEGQSFFAKGGRPFCKSHAR